MSKRRTQPVKVRHVHICGDGAIGQMLLERDKRSPLMVAEFPSGSALIACTVEVGAKDPQFAGVQVSSNSSNDSERPLLSGRLKGDRIAEGKSLGALSAAGGKSVVHGLTRMDVDVLVVNLDGRIPSTVVTLPEGRALRNAINLVNWRPFNHDRDLGGSKVVIDGRLGGFATEKERSILLLDGWAFTREYAVELGGSSWDRCLPPLLKALSEHLHQHVQAHYSTVLVRVGPQAVILCQPGRKQWNAELCFDPHSAVEDATAWHEHDQEIFAARFALELVRFGFIVDGTMVPDLSAKEDRIGFAMQQALRAVLQARNREWGYVHNIVRAPRTVMIDTAAPDPPFARTDVSKVSGRQSMFSVLLKDKPDRIWDLAASYVRTGVLGEFTCLPRVRFGKFLSIDPDEIEQYHRIRHLVDRYIDSSVTKPLAFGVFGQPGSGKSFGVKQLAFSYGDKKVKWVSMNMSEFESRESFVRVLQRLRDHGPKGPVPFVLVDEFDCSLQAEPYGWFRHFLAPVNDGEFLDRDQVHPLGKVIFAFTGGTANTYAEFRDKCKPRGHRAANEAKERKMPDMLSRLVDHLDIKGVSEVGNEMGQGHLVRRAIVLRSQLSDLFKLQPGESAPVDEDMLISLLLVPEYNNGTRAMENLLKSCNLEKFGRICRAALPPPEQLDVFVNLKAWDNTFN